MNLQKQPQAKFRTLYVCAHIGMALGVLAVKGLIMFVVAKFVCHGLLSKPELTMLVFGGFTALYIGINLYTLIAPRNGKAFKHDYHQLKNDISRIFPD